MVCVTSKGSDQPAHTRSLISLCWSFEYSMSVKLLTEHHLEFLSLKGGCIGLSESTLVKIPIIVGNHMPRPICRRCNKQYADKHIFWHDFNMDSIWNYLPTCLPTISQLAYDYLTYIGGDYPCTLGIQLTSRPTGRRTYLVSWL